MLGVLLRVGHYLANYPLWGDEAFLALSFLSPRLPRFTPAPGIWATLRSSFCGLTRAVKFFGFSEMSLRLCPLICGVGSLLLFRQVASRVLSGWTLLLAVAIFAVSIHPIRHRADAKPYASDLLVALGMLALAIESIRRPNEPAGSGYWSALHRSL